MKKNYNKIIIILSISLFLIATIILYNNFNKKDTINPICGNVTGESTKWTNEDRTISVECIDNESGCIKEKITKTFKTTTKSSFIEIKDKKGNTTLCPVNVYLDKTSPKCELEVNEDEVSLKNTFDKESGIYTYGISTNQNKIYNEEPSIIVSEGITTVFGFIKDKAGNEGKCTKEVIVNKEKSNFDIRYGYQIYPNYQSNYALKEIEENNNILTTLTSDSKIIINNLLKYTDIDKVIISLNENIEKDTKATLKYGENTYHALMIKNTRKIEFDVDSSKTENIEIILGDIANTRYNISKIELLSKNGNIATDKDVTVYIIPLDKGFETTEISFDNGLSFTSYKEKTFTNNTTNEIITININNIQSDSKTFTITGIDKQIPSLSLRAIQDSTSLEIPSNTWITSGLNFELTLTSSGLNETKMYYCQDTSNECNPTTIAQDKTLIKQFNTLNGIYYIRYKAVSNSGAMSPIESYIAKVDNSIPKVSIIANKKDQKTIVPSQITSNEGLNFTFFQETKIPNDSIIYYCYDTINTCNPTTIAPNGETITELNNIKGTYYVRYKIVSGSLVSSNIFTYIAIVENNE